MAIRPLRRGAAFVVAASLMTTACSSTDSPTAPDGSQSQAEEGTPPGAGGRAVSLEVTEVATGLDTVWSLDWDPRGRLWYTERPGRLARDGSQTVLVDGIPAGFIHDGGRLRLGPDGTLYASTGETGDESLAQDPSTLAGKILAIDPGSGDVAIYSTGHRNAQGLCFTPAGRFLATEHGPDFGDEINVITEGSNGGWPEVSGNGINNYTPTIAPAGCAVYDADLIPQWKGSMLFVTLKDSSLRRLTFARDGSVADEQVLFSHRFGRLRDVAVGPDGAVYLATSNRDGRGDRSPGDDTILRVAPAR